MLDAAVISYSDYREAGFSEAQSRLLVERAQIVRDQFANVTEQMSRGFADMQVTSRPASTR